MGNGIFWSEIASGFGDAGSTPPPNPHPGMSYCTIIQWCMFMIMFISVVFLDETVKGDALNGHQNTEEAKKEENEPIQWPAKESSSKSTAQSSSEKRNKRF